MKNIHSISAKAPVIGGKQYHIDCSDKDVAPFVILPGDPKRVTKIASLWDEYHEVADHREYHTVTGKFQGIPISCTSTGIGSPSLTIAIDELSRIGVHTFIRTGTCGGLQKDMKLGDIVISTGAVRFEGASKDLVIPEYPAVAHFEVTLALIQAAEELQIPYHVGVTASADTFYTGQSRPALGGYLPSFKEHVVGDLQMAGVKNFEMEVSGLLTFASVFGKRAGAVCVVIANRVTDEFQISDDFEKRPGRVASRAIAILSEWDKKKTKAGKKFLYPDLLK